MHLKIYTRAGDKGETSLLGKDKVPKDSLQVECYGTVDEANSVMGLARGLVVCQRIKDILEQVQDSLFVVGAELASPPDNLSRLKERVDENKVRDLEAHIDELTRAYPLEQGFVLPGGTPGAGALDQGRTVVRRAERLVTRLAREQVGRDGVLQYLNRLSDLLFVMARAETREALKEEVRAVVRRVHAGGANAQKPGSLNLVLARQLLYQAQEKARELNVPVAVAVCDDGGNLVALERQDDALLASIEVARKKAYTAVALKMSTAQLHNLVQPGQPLYGLTIGATGGYVALGGGLPLWQGRVLMGAIGVSGGSAEQDEAIAGSAASALEERGVGSL